MSSVLDTVTSGGLLPYVYFRKITLERAQQDPSKTDVTLLLELYQDKNKLAESSWLNSLDDINGQGSNFLDAMYIQVLPLVDKDNVLKLLPSHNPTTGRGNIYTAKQYLTDAYLPRGRGPDPGGKRYVPVALFKDETPTWDPESGDPEPAPGAHIPDAMPVSISSLMGNVTQRDALPTLENEGKIREEVINGKPYYVIPFEYRYSNFDEKLTANLGFAAYTFLHVPHWISQLGIVPETQYEEFFEQYVVEGPPNAEVVFLDGKAQTKRQAFFLPSGLVWEGAVHLHAENSEAPDGYYGDGGISGVPIINEKEDGQVEVLHGGDFRGWMVGASHHSPNLPKLRLAEVPNNKLSDFRSGLFPTPIDKAIDLTGDISDIFSLRPSVTTALEKFISPFQKEKKKDLVKDNDSEFSKLYISRDTKNNAKGVFFINTLELLRNNSNLFPLLFGSTGGASFGGPTPQESAAGTILNKNREDIYKILQKSNLLELRLYRDRVKKHSVGPRYEKYANDKDYEEPSFLVATISDQDGGGQIAQSPQLSEITLGELSRETDADYATRYFMFADHNVSKKTAGLYRYRVEFEYKDGTYEFLYELFHELSIAKVDLDKYYDYSTSYFTEVGPADFTFNNAMTEEKYKKKNFKKYYQNGAFVGQFLDKMEEVWPSGILFPGDNLIQPWNIVPPLLKKVARIFGFPTFSGTEFDITSTEYVSMLDPVSGSPQGINFFSRLLDTSIKRIQSLMDATKVNKTGSEIDNKTVPNGYTFNSMLDVVVSPSDFTIREQHTFDHPNEMFEAISNKNIYVDYLSIFSPLLPGVVGVRSMSTQYFKNRCQLEATKLSDLAKSSSGFNGSLQSARISLKGGEEDTFSRTGYSYLAPSIVELSDPVRNSPGYNFYYSCFSLNAMDYLNSIDLAPKPNLFSSFFNNYVNYEKLFISLLNYSASKRDTVHADLTEAYPAAPDLKTQKLVQPLLDHREPYKRIFEDLGITVHSAALYNKFFNKPAGALGDDIPDGDEFPLSQDDFSDGMLQYAGFLKNLLINRNQNSINVQSNSTMPAGHTTHPKTKKFIDLPNNFKIARIRKDHLSNSGQDPLQTALKPIFDQPESSLYNAFLFFNINLTAKIEVFRGIPAPPRNQAPSWASTRVNSKNDENSWSLLKENDLSGLDNKKLLCRLSLYDETLARQIKLPILDKYFLIYDNASDQIPPAPIKLAPNGDAQETRNAEARRFWERQNRLQRSDRKARTEESLVSNEPVRASSRRGTGTPRKRLKEYGLTSDARTNGAQRTENTQATTRATERRSNNRSGSPNINVNNTGRGGGGTTGY